jgi:type IV pilus assembly protein PilW
MERAERNKGNSRSGFSLVELLVAMAITAVVMAAVFKIYTTQQDSYVLQEQVAEMQQKCSKTDGQQNT